MKRRTVYYIMALIVSGLAIIDIHLFFRSLLPYEEIFWLTSGWCTGYIIKAFENGEFKEAN